MMFGIRFQFSMADLFVGLTFLAIGCGGLSAMMAWPGHSIAATLAIAFSSGAAIGAGLLSPFKKKDVGAIVGFALIVPTLALIDQLTDRF
jgi:hypothetical protein